ncbi:MAG: hypothetical protein FWC10_07615 [Lentimicrobiaceae bacterium]|nr:hypothetical protein [Lentimicrobiaceae bacterium]
MKFFLSYTLLVINILLLAAQSLNAQRLEVHAIKDFSTNEQANKAWGVGGTFEFDQLVKKATFKIYFDWAMHNDKNDINKKPKYQRMVGGIIACFSHDFSDKFTIQLGGEVNYAYLKHSYIYAYEPIPPDTVGGRSLTLLQTGGFIGIGPHVGLLYKLTSQFSVVLNVAPTFLIPVHAKSSVLTKDPEYKKGVWLFPIRLGFSYQLFKKD